MKKIQCQHCDHIFIGNEQDSVLMEMLAHYQTKHVDVMANLTDEIKQDWMQKFNKQWDNQ